MNLDETQKATIWTKLAQALGIEPKAEVTELAETPVAPTPATEAPETPEEEKAEDDAMAKLTAQVAELQKQVDELMKANGTAVAEKDAATKEATALAAQLAEIKSKPADKKVILSSQPEAMSPAQAAWQRYTAK